jgi:hypothetical protein
LGEEVLGIHTTSGSATLQTFLAILIIYRSLLWIGENFVRV